MSDEPTYPPTQGTLDLRGQVLGIRRSLDTIRDDLQSLSVVRQVWNVPVRNHVLPGNSLVGPTAVAGGLGPLSGTYEYAYSYESPYLHGETPLSGTTATAVLAANYVTVGGARSLDTYITKVNIYRRKSGGTDLDWVKVGTVDNPTAGTWTFDDESSDTDVLSNPNPLTFNCPLWVVCGPNYVLRRVKVKPEGDLEASSTDYWILRLLWRLPNQQWPARITREMDTTLSGMSSTALANTFIASEAGPPRVDLRFPLAENGTLYLGLRGVGAPPPMPELSCQVEVSRQEV